MTPATRIHHKLRGRLSLRAEVAVASIGMLILTAAAWAGVYLALGQASDRARRVIHTHEVIESANAIGRDTLEAQSGMRGYVLTGDQSFLDQFYEGNKLFDLDLTHARSLVVDNPPQESCLVEINDLYDDWARTVKPLLERPTVVEFSSEDRRVVRAGKQRIDALRNKLDRFVSVERELLAHRERSSLTSSKRLNLIVALGTWVLVLVGAGGAMLLARRIARQVALFTGSAQAIASGDLKQRIDLDLQDEMGALARSFNVMADRLESREAMGALLQDLRQMLHAAHTTADARQIICSLAPLCLPGTAGRLFLLNPSRNLLTVAAAWGEGLGDEPFSPEACWSFRLGRAHLVTPARATVPCDHRAPDQSATACIPLMAQGETVGLLHLAVPSGELPKLITDFSEILSLTVANLRLRETMRCQATRDALTGLFNRRYLDETLHREFARATRTGAPISIVMLDVDHFKRFNDLHGHGAGDAVLRDVAVALKKTFRDSDVVCRYGGEEFLALLPDCSLPDALRRAEAARVAVGGVRTVYDENVLESVTISAGVAAFPAHGREWDDVVRAADGALYESKRAGRDRVTGAPAPNGLHSGPATSEGDGRVENDVEEAELRA